MNIFQNPASLSLNPFTQPASHSQPSVNCIQFYKLTEFSTIHIFTDFPTSPLPFTRQYYFPLSIQKKDKDGKRGKGRLCCLGGRRIHSIPCGPSCFASDNFEEYDEFVFFQIILVPFILLFKIVLGKTASAARNRIQFFRQTEATTFAFYSVFILLLCRCPSQSNTMSLAFTILNIAILRYIFNFSLYFQQ